MRKITTRGELQNYFTREMKKSYGEKILGIILRGWVVCLMVHRVPATFKDPRVALLIR